MLTKSSVVLDSGILLTTVEVGEYTTAAVELVNFVLESDAEIAAPVLSRYEMVAVVRKWVYRGLTTSEKANVALTTLLNYPITLHFDDALLKRAYELATIYNLPTAYDAQYLALAERLNCDFWTVDERLFNAVSGQMPTVKWLGNWKTPPTT